MVPSIFGENLFDEFWNDPFDMDRSEVQTRSLPD